MVTTQISTTFTQVCALLKLGITSLNGAVSFSVPNIANIIAGSSIEIRDGTSKVEINLPRTIKPKESVSINIGGSPKEFVVSDDNTSSQTTPKRRSSSTCKSAKISFDSDLGSSNRTPNGKIDTSENRYNDGDPTKTLASIKIPSVIKAISDGAITILDVTVRSKY